MKEKVTNLQLKFILVFLGLGIICSVVISVLIYFQYHNYIISSVQNTLKDAGKLIESQMPVLGEIDYIRQEGIAESEAYMDILNKLQEYSDAFGFAFVYLVEKNGEDFIFLLDTDNLDQDTDNTFFTPYVEMADFLDEVIKSRQIAMSDIYTDKWGTFISAFIPVIRQNKVVSIIGLDYEVSLIRSLERRALLQIMLNLTITIPFVIIAAIIISITFVNFVRKTDELNKNLVSANSRIEIQKKELQNYNDNLEGLVKIKTKSILKLQNTIMETIAELVDCRDKTTGGHIARTSKYMKIFIDAMITNRLYREQTALWNIDLMTLSANLHDVGKIAINDSILNKMGRFTEDEYEEMKKHTIYGGEIIQNIKSKIGENEFLDYAHSFAVYHHEKWDGSGYPYGLNGENIPLPARLLAIIDVFDALISARPYKEPFSYEDAVKIIKDGSGSHFDPILTELFLSVSDQLINGAKSTTPP
jgi:HD-GYP domain-containing protein (c-di-GMP phosphodiesterase class II)